MKKATLNFIIKDNDKRPLLDAIHGTQWRLVVESLDDHLRSEYKYNAILSKEESEYAESLRDKLREIVYDHGLTLNGDVE